MKYSFDDLKKFQFGGNISRDTRKILFNNNIWNPDHPDHLETFIVKCTFNNIDHFICGLYHPSKESYSDARLISHIDNISNFMLDHNNRFPLGGDFNSLSHNSFIQTGLQSIYYGPTHKGNNLDRLYGRYDRLYGINIDPKLFNPYTYVSHIKTWCYCLAS